MRIVAAEHLRKPHPDWCRPSIHSKYRYRDARATATIILLHLTSERVGINMQPGDDLHLRFSPSGKNAGRQYSRDIALDLVAWKTSYACAASYSPPTTIYNHPYFLQYARAAQRANSSSKLCATKSFWTFAIVNVERVFLCYIIQTVVIKCMSCQNSCEENRETLPENLLWDGG